MNFKYFAYGSNMLTERMKVNCPTAVKHCVAVLKDHSLAFTGFVKAWKGSSVTIVPDPGNNVWGVVWDIENKHEQDLERQEATYRKIIINAETPDHEIVSCKVFQKDVPDTEIDAKPSAVYKAVIVKGALEHGLPQEYVDYIGKFQDNGFQGPVDIPITNPLGEKTEL